MKIKQIIIAVVVIGLIYFIFFRKKKVEETTTQNLQAPRNPVPGDKVYAAKEGIKSKLNTLQYKVHKKGELVGTFQQEKPAGYYEVKTATGVLSYIKTVEATKTGNNITAAKDGVKSQFNVAQTITNKLGALLGTFSVAKSATEWELKAATGMAYVNPADATIVQPVQSSAPKTAVVPTATPSLIK